MKLHWSRLTQYTNVFQLRITKTDYAESSLAPVTPQPDEKMCNKNMTEHLLRAILQTKQKL